MALNKSTLLKRYGKAAQNLNTGDTVICFDERPRALQEWRLATILGFNANTNRYQIRFIGARNPHWVDANQLIFQNDMQDMLNIGGRGIRFFRDTEITFDLLDSLNDAGIVACVLCPVCEHFHRNYWQHRATHYSEDPKLVWTPPELKPYSAYGRSKRPRKEPKPRPAKRRRLDGNAGLSPIRSPDDDDDDDDEDEDVDPLNAGYYRSLPDYDDDDDGGGAAGAVARNFIRVRPLAELRANF